MARDKRSSIFDVELMAVVLLLVDKRGAYRRRKATPLVDFDGFDLGRCGISSKSMPVVFSGSQTRAVASTPKAPSYLPTPYTQHRSPQQTRATFDEVRRAGSLVHKFVRRRQ